MARLDLIGGAYAARSIIANAQRCINVYPEKNREDSVVPFTYYQRPGLKKQSSPPVAGIGRGVLRDSQGNGYAVAPGIQAGYARDPCQQYVRLRGECRFAKNYLTPSKIRHSERAHQQCQI